MGEYIQSTMGEESLDTVEYIETQQLFWLPYLPEVFGQAWANSIDPDQMLHSAASDQGLYCLPLIQQFFKHINRY